MRTFSKCLCWEKCFINAMLLVVLEMLLKMSLEASVKPRCTRESRTNQRLLSGAYSGRGQARWEDAGGWGWLNSGIGHLEGEEAWLYAPGVNIVMAYFYKSRYASSTQILCYLFSCLSQCQYYNSHILLFYNTSWYWGYFFFNISLD